MNTEKVSSDKVKKTDKSPQSPKREEWLQEARFRMLVEQVNGYAIFMIDPLGFATSWNEGVKRILSYEEDEFIYHEIAPLIFIPEDVLKGVPQQEMETAALRGSANDDRWMQRKGGERFWASGITSAVKDSNGQIVGFTKVMSDMTEQKRIKEALQESEAFNRRIMESTQDSIQVLDLKGNLLAMNMPGKCALEIDDLLQDSWLNLWQGEDRNNALAAINAAASGSSGWFEASYPTMMTKTTKWWHTVVTPILDSEQRPMRLLAISRDITANKRNEQALEAAVEKAEKANRAKSEFLANMSHEIRTPMNAVVGLAQILSMNRLLPVREKEYIATLQASANQLMALINDMLDVSKIESSMVELEQIAFNPLQLINDCLKVIFFEAQKKGLAVAVQSDCSEDIRLIGDVLRLRQIMMNLLSNAIKFTEKGSIMVTLNCADDAHIPGNSELVLIIADTGIGMAPEICEKIFAKFTQADSSITRKYGGTGLGLAISKQLAELMGGKIAVKSELGKGTEFIVSLSLAKYAAAKYAQNSTTYDNISDDLAEIKKRKKLKILLVEDYQPNVLVAVTLLDGMGHRCGVANSGEEAISKLENETFDLVLMDVQMYDLDGFETTRRIRCQEEQTRRPPITIIAMTAHALAGDKEKCLEAGMNDYIAKPFNFNELQSKIMHHASQLNKKNLFEI